MEQKWTYGLWGAAAGAIALAVVGFSWGGWQTASSANQIARRTHDDEDGSVAREPTARQDLKTSITVAEPRPQLP